MDKPSFYLGTIPIKGNLLLAPMDGFSDQPFRAICREFGSAVSITEFINTTDVLQNHPYLLKRISFSNDERPIGFQIYGNNSIEVLQAAEILMKYSPDFLDFNLGCSERHVASRGAGSGLLKYPKIVREIISLLVSNFHIPITAKIRIGWDKKSLNYLEIAKILEGCGVSMISIHGRTRDQRWREPALWQPIASVKKSVSIPIVGNGDVKNLDDIERMFSLTACDAVMIGRAAIGNPWIFSRIDKNEIEKPEILRMVAQHWKSASEFYGRERALNPFRKHLKRYLDSPQLPDLDLKQIVGAEDPIEMLVKVSQFP